MDMSPDFRANKWHKRVIKNEFKSDHELCRRNFDRIVARTHVNTCSFQRTQSRTPTCTSSIGPRADAISPLALIKHTAPHPTWRKGGSGGTSVPFPFAGPLLYQRRPSLCANAVYHSYGLSARRRQRLLANQPPRVRPKQRPTRMETRRLPMGRDDNCRRREGKR